jgi:hypothetical protein
VNIDDFRRELRGIGISPDDAAIVVGLTAEYAQQAYMEGYNRGEFQLSHRMVRLF